jgi:hypothetical protein
MRSHFRISTGSAMACAVTGATAMMTGICSGQIAADSPTDPAYAAGWSAAQAPQNGGFGFGAWSFANSTGSPVQAALGTSSVLGTSWTLFNPSGPPGGSDLVDAGRSITGGLQVGETISTTIANPTQEHFFRGYTILLGSGGQNIGYDKVGTRLAVGTFEYFTYGRWYADGSVNNSTSLFDTQTALHGMTVAVTLTGQDTYHLAMTPVGNPALAYVQDGTLNGAGTINWIQFQLYNTTSTGPDDQSADFFISGLSIVPEPSTLALAGLGSAALLFLRRRNQRPE